MGIIDLVEIKKYFPIKKGAFSKQGWLKAVDGVRFSIEEGRVFSLVGESGSGKSTVARLVLRLIPLTSGKIFFRGRDILEFKGESLKEFRKSVQIIFQDPFASLNPRMTVFDTLSEPLKIHRIVKRSELKDKVVNLLRSVGLGPEVLNRYPHEFSGGQRQRICIARALSVSPAVLVADEPLSALDVSIQAQILNILQELKNQTNISFLFISHDLRVVQYFSDEIAVMYLGKIVEYAKADDLFSNPLHPYTVELLSSVPKITIRRDAERREAHFMTNKGENPGSVVIPSGCAFHSRCARRFEPCDNVAPELKEKKGRLVSCHLF
ncbi:MAG: oligopeptide/dipeptide ABC transporter ATP-binding protein [Nitrospirota bacterium]